MNRRENDVGLEPPAITLAVEGWRARDAEWVLGVPVNTTDTITSISRGQWGDAEVDVVNGRVVGWRRRKHRTMEWDAQKMGRVGDCPAEDVTALCRNVLAVRLEPPCTAMYCRGKGCVHLFGFSPGMRVHAILDAESPEVAAAVAVWEMSQ